MNREKPVWLICTEYFQNYGPKTIEQSLLESHTFFVQFEYNSGLGQYTKIQQQYPFDNRPYVCYGPIKFIKQCHKHNFTPGGFGFKDNISLEHYMSNVPLDWFLNGDGLILTWGMFRKQLDKFTNSFIRPVSPYKTFTGFSIDTLDELIFEVNSIEQLNNIQPEERIFIALKKEILGEFRFVIVDGEVVTGSEYRWDDVLDIRSDVDKDCEFLAQMVGRHPWQPDVAYVVDIAKTNSGPRIIEYNSFASSGLYACDTDKIVKAVNKAAINDFYGEDL